MQSGFEDIKLGWQDKDYVIPANRVLGAVARIEQHITLHEILAYSERSTAPMAVLAQAYASVLRYAGAQITDEDVYQGMFTDGDTTDIVNQLLNGLLGMMLPPAHQQKTAKVNKPGNSRKAAKNSSRSSTKRRSATAG